MMEPVFSYIKTIPGKPPGLAAELLLFSVILLSAVCSNDSTDRTLAGGKSASRDIGLTENRFERLKETEKKLVENEIPHIVIDFQKQRIYIKAGEVVLNDLEFEIISDRVRVQNFLASAREKDRIDFKLIRVHIFSGIELVGEMEIEAVARALGADYDDIQKYSPLDMSISLSPGLIIRIKSEGPGESLGFLSNIFESTRLFFQELFGVEKISLKMKTADAMALYGACRGRFPKVLVI